VFSIGWFARRLSADVVVVVRSPAALVGSTKRLGWGFDTRFLLSQPRLLRDSLEHERAALEAPPTNVVEQAALLWRLVYETAAVCARELKEVRIVRHEDLSLDPVGSFERLYDRLGLSFNRRARRVVERTTRAGNPEESPLDDPGAIRLDSRANLEVSRGRLTADELDLVQRQTAEVARLFYS
jgi:hypothetical protein